MGDNPRWEPKFGPAFITGIIQIAAMLVGGGIVWTNLQNSVNTANASISELKIANGFNTDAINRHDNRLTKAETAIDFIVPSLKRIEDKLDTIARK